MKKDFTASGNSALNFISQESIDRAEGKPEAKRKPREAKKPAPKEIKSRRVQILIQPSVYDAIKAKAEEEGISTNEAIIQAMKEYTK